MAREIEFKDLVIKDVKESVTQHYLVRLKNNVVDWLIELNSFKRDVELQLTAQKARIIQTKIDDKLTPQERKNRLDEQEDRRLKLIRLSVAIERKILDVKKLRSIQHNDY